ncbi:hypothetical protein K9M48_03770 [Candidatus Gracilibacteria bacterium]|nr:hypothetical protein [Candidatus Gracilibacteria bacterium]
MQKKEQVETGNKKTKKPNTPMTTGTQKLIKEALDKKPKTKINIREQ